MLVRILWLVLAALLAGCAPADRPDPHAVRGVLPLASVPARPVQLSGEWAFSWNVFEPPGWTELPASGFAPVPDDWNTLPSALKPPGPEGWGSYRLRVDCPVGERLALLVPSERTAMHLYANGERILSQGDPGRSAETTRAAIRDRNVITREVACPLRLTAHVANFDHRAGGMVRAMRSGSTEALSAWREGRIVREALLLGAYVFTGFVMLLFWLGRPREKLTLVFSLVCWCVAVYADIAGERLALRLWAPELSWAAAVRLEYLSRTAALGLFFLTLQGLFTDLIPRWTVRAVLGLCGAVTLLVLLTPAGVYSHIALPGQALSIVIGACAGWALVRGGWGLTDVRILLAGLAAVLVSLAVDLLLLVDANGGRQPVAPVGFALFLLSPAWIFARRLAKAAFHAERSRTLEENARLREDVERISRHDLRTPLAGMVGISRLLSHDPRLAPDQKDLVAKLQQSGLRALEMVNLSLGLYRMEAGTYALQPEAVDLGEVAGRVTRDLADLAATREVSVRLPAAAPGTRRAWAEDVLCYAILANLIRNAIEATQPGGAVDIRLEDDGGPLRMAIHNPTAVPAEIAGRFFEKYSSAGKVGGTGLGTYSARLMARAQGGDVTLQTDAVTGTTLTVSLPAAPAEAVAASSAGGGLLEAAVPGSGSASDPGGAGGTPGDVLVVDDDEVSRFVTSRLLAQAGWTVRTAGDGQAGLDAARAQWPRAVVMDAEMPVLGGLEAVRQLREHEARNGLPRCLVVMLSAHADPQALQAAQAAGADQCLTKPVSSDALQQALQPAVR